MESRSPFRCYDGRFLIEAIVIAVALIGLAILGKPLAPRTPGRIAIALLETALLGWLIARSLLQVRKLDEMQQRIHLIAIAISFGTAGVAAIGAEYLAHAGVPVPAPGLWVWMLMLVVWGVGVAVLARRYR